MNEQMQNALAKLIDKASSGIDESVGFLSAETSDVINQLLMYKMVASLSSVFIFSVILSLHLHKLQSNKRLR